MGFAGSVLLFLPCFTSSSCSLFLASRLSGWRGDFSGAEGGGPSTVGCETGVALFDPDVCRHRAHIGDGLYWCDRAKEEAARSDDRYREEAPSMR